MVTPVSMKYQALMVFQSSIHLQALGEIENHNIDFIIALQYIWTSEWDLSITMKN
jgi:hypothetical protein